MEGLLYKQHSCVWKLQIYNIHIQHTHLNEYIYIVEVD